MGFIKNHVPNKVVCSNNIKKGCITIKFTIMILIDRKSATINLGGSSSLNTTMEEEIPITFSILKHLKVSPNKNFEFIH